MVKSGKIGVLSIKLGKLIISNNESEEILKELVMNNVDEFVFELVADNIFELLMLVKEHGNILEKKTSQHLEFSVGG